MTVVSDQQMAARFYSPNTCSATSVDRRVLVRVQDSELPEEVLARHTNQMVDYQEVATLAVATLAVATLAVATLAVATLAVATLAVATLAGLHDQMVSTKLRH